MIKPHSLWLTDFVIYIFLQKILISFSLQLPAFHESHSQSETQPEQPNIKPCYVRLETVTRSHSVPRNLHSTSKTKVIPDVVSLQNPTVKPPQEQKTFKIPSATPQCRLLVYITVTTTLPQILA